LNGEPTLYQAAFASAITPTGK